jgi:hypothetical protein
MLVGNLGCLLACMMYMVQYISNCWVTDYVGQITLSRSYRSKWFCNVGCL